VSSTEWLYLDEENKKMQAPLTILSVLFEFIPLHLSLLLTQTSFLSSTFAMTTPICITNPIMKNKPNSTAQAHKNTIYAIPNISCGLTPMLSAYASIPVDPPIVRLELELTGGTAFPLAESGELLPAVFSFESHFPYLL
jgi:hypothetical protein